MRNRREELEGGSSRQPRVATQSSNDDIAILRWYHALMMAVMRGTRCAVGLPPIAAG